MLTDNTNDLGHHLTVLQLTVFQFYPVHPSTPMKDQDRIIFSSQHPYNISSKQVMRIKRKIT